MKLKTMLVWLSVVAGTLGGASSGAWAAEPPGLAGKWEGAVIFLPGDHEVDILVDFVHKPDGGWTGELAVPAESARYDLKNLVVEGRKVSFEYEIEGRGARKYRGELTEDGQKIQGEYRRDAESFPFEVDRRREWKTAPSRPEVRNLSADLAELRKQFNQDAGKVRVLFLSSPNALIGNGHARLLQKYLLDGVQDWDLRVYVLWFPYFEEDNRELAEKAALNLPDERALHFWTQAPSVSGMFTKMVKIKEIIGDLLFIYPRTASWEETIPAPRSLFHSGHELSEDRLFNASTVTKEVLGTLAADRP